MSKRWTTSQLSQDRNAKLSPLFHFDRVCGYPSFKAPRIRHRCSYTTVSHYGDACFPHKEDEDSIRKNLVLSLAHQMATMSTWLTCLERTTIWWIFWNLGKRSLPCHESLSACTMCFMDFFTIFFQPDLDGVVLEGRISIHYHISCLYRAHFLLMRAWLKVSYPGPHISSSAFRKHVILLLMMTLGVPRDADEVFQCSRSRWCSEVSDALIW